MVCRSDRIDTRNQICARHASLHNSRKDSHPYATLDWYDSINLSSMRHLLCLPNHFNLPRSVVNNTSMRFCHHFGMVPSRLGKFRAKITRIETRSSHTINLITRCYNQRTSTLCYYAFARLILERLALSSANHLLLSYHESVG